MMPKIHKKFISDLTENLKNDSRFIGLTIGGSYLTNEMDEYSDVDLILVVDPDSYDEVMGERSQIAEGFGNLFSAFTGEHVGEPRLLICLYGPEALHVDLKFVTPNDFKNRVEDPHIIFEKNSCISNVIKESIAEFPIPSLQWIEDRFWIWIHYGALKIGRGEIFESIEFISFLRQVVIGPMSLMKNDKLPRGVRKLEMDASNEADILKGTIAEYNPLSCIKSLEILIDLYLSLRSKLATDELIEKTEAEKCAIEYLRSIKNKYIV